jgi:hypothetical protein
LITDPSQPQQTGTVTTGLLGGTAGTQTPQTTQNPNVNPAIPYPFRPVSAGAPIFQLLQGVARGLAGSTGYKGLSALGAGANASLQGAMDQQKYNMDAMLGGQQYLKGQQALVGGNLDNQFALMKTNAMRRSLGLPDVSMGDLMNNPDLVNNPSGGQAATNGTTAQPGQSGQSSDMNSGNANVNTAYGTSAASYPSNGAAATAASVQQQTAQAASDPNNPFADQMAAIHQRSLWDAPGAKVDLDALQASPQYQQWLAQMKANNENMTPRANAPVITMRGGVPSVVAAPSIDQSGATGYNVYGNNGQATHFQTGLPTGVPEAYTAAVNRNNQIQDQYSGSASIERQNTLSRMEQLANGPTQFGPGREHVAYWKAWAQAIPGASFILDPSDGTADEKNMEVMRKYMSTLGAQYQSMLGGKGTDAQLENSLERIPGPDRLNAAIKDLVPYLRSLEAAGQGNVNARALWIQNHGGVPSGKAYLDFEGAWRGAYDPRVYQYLEAARTGGGADWIRQNVRPNELAAFKAHAQALGQMGALP